MKKIAVYPGSFDPVTNGHIDIIKRAVKLFDSVIIAVVANPNKKAFFSVEDRLEMLKLSTTKIKGITVTHFNGLLVNYMNEKKSNVLIRGLRAISDFEYEFQMALMNRKLSQNIETVFLMPAEAYTYLSSNITKEIARLGGNIDCLVPREIRKYIYRIRGTKS